MDSHNDLSRYGSNRVVGREPCGRCRAGGGDKSGDNLIVYADGHKHCFGCGSHHHAPVTMDSIRKMAERAKEAAVTLDEFANRLEFPRDFTPLDQALFAKEPQHWLASYGITGDEIKKHGIGWSAKDSLLIFPWYNTAGNLLMWQGRNFSGKGPKYVTKGPKSEVNAYIGNTRCDTLVVVEDFVSAIKVGRTFAAMPLWGADMTLGQVQTANKRFGDLVVWLDSNKVRDAVKLALRASQYMPTCVVSSGLDPKQYSLDAIVELVWTAQKKDSMFRDQEHPVTPFLVTLPSQKEQGTHPTILDENGVPIRNQDGSEHSYTYKESHGS
jgi:hypothetical protein